MQMFQEREILEKPYFMIKFNGNKISKARHQKVSEVEVDEIDEKADVARIVFDDKDKGVVNDSMITEDTKVEIEMGHEGGFKRTVFKGQIKTVSVDFSASGLPVVEIKCIDESDTLNKEEKSDNWEEKKKTEVAKEVIERNGFTAKIEARKNEEPVEVITQDKETDMQFLARLAKEEGYHVYRVNEFNSKTMYFGLTKEGEEPVGTLKYGLGDTPIISFKPDFHPNFIDSKSEKEDVSDSKKEEESAEKENDKSRATGDDSLVSYSTGEVTRIRGEKKPSR